MTKIIDQNYHAIGDVIDSGTYGDAVVVERYWPEPNRYWAWYPKITQFLHFNAPKPIVSQADAALIIELRNRWRETAAYQSNKAKAPY